MSDIIEEYGIGLVMMIVGIAAIRVMGQILEILGGGL